ncbi:hypothetical protein PSP6_480008 [Paraburkholderia tropica]|nr:hypothetical protein PSP6_480008 [Paraburkholderia tropica]
MFRRRHSIVAPTVRSGRLRACPAMIVGRSRRNGIKTMKRGSCSYQRLTRSCQFVNAEEREGRGRGLGAGASIRAMECRRRFSSTLAVKAWLARNHERCFILMSGWRSERLLILDFALTLAVVPVANLAVDPEVDADAPSLLKRRQP